MAMQNNTKKRDDERNVAMHLIISEDRSPAIKWITSPLFKNDSELDAVKNPGIGVWEEGILIKHQWGGLKYEDVVIPMGRIVALGDPTQDYIMGGEYVNTIILPGMYTTDEPNWVGIAPYNYINPSFQEDAFGGNQPAVATHVVVELPYIPQIKAAQTFDKAGMLYEEATITRMQKNPWGAVINPYGMEGIILKAGDYVKMTPSGRVTKWIKGTDDIDLRIGKILAVDWNQKKHGLLNWLLWDMNALHEDAPYTKKGFPPQDGWGYDEKYREIKNKQAGYITPSMTIENMTGIPGLHDGSGQSMGFGINDTHYENVALMKDGVAIATPFTATAGEIYEFKPQGPYGEEVKQLVEGSITVKLNGDVLTQAQAAVVVDHFNGKVTIVCLADFTGVLTCNLKKKFAGVPSYADFVGVVGTVKIQLIPR